MIADKNFEKLENSAVKLTVTVKAEAADKAYNDLLTKWGREAQLPGFRKAKFPGMY